MTKYHALGGIRENPGTWDNGNGAIVEVSRNARGVIRRVVTDYSGRGQSCVYYTCDQRDTGGAYRPDGVERFDSAARAVKAAHTDLCEVTAKP